MTLYKLIQDGRPTLINGDHILSVTYEEESRKLEIRFINGESLTLVDAEAASGWDTFRDYAMNEEDETDHDEEDDDTEPREDLEEINSMIVSLEDQVRNKGVTRGPEAYRLRSHADSLGEYWGYKKRQQLADEIKATKQRAYKVADEAEVVELTNEVSDCLTTPIATQTSVKSILRRLNEAESELKRKGALSDELKTNIRGARSASRGIERKRNWTNPA